MSSYAVKQWSSLLTRKFSLLARRGDICPMPWTFPTACWRRFVGDFPFADLGKTENCPRELQGVFRNTIWVFPKIVVPQNGWFTMENPINVDMALITPPPPQMFFFFGGTQLSNFCQTWPIWSCLLGVVVLVLVVVVDNCPAQGGFIIGTQFIIEIWGARGVPPFRACLEVTF